MDPFSLKFLFLVSSEGDFKFCGSQGKRETFFFFLIKILGKRGRPEWLPYLDVIIVAPYPLDPEGTGEP